MLNTQVTKVETFDRSFCLESVTVMDERLILDICPFL